MLNRGLIEKTVRECWLVAVICGGALGAIQFLLAYLTPQMSQQVAADWLEMEFVRGIMKALLGTQVGEQFSADFMHAMPWVHPAALASIWAYEITHCSRFPAGEIDRGTVDTLMGLPVSRWQVYVNDTVVWLFAGLVMILVGFGGSLLGNSVAGTDGAAPGRLGMLLLNFYFLYIAVGGLAYFVSSLASRRGRAVGLVVFVLTASFILNFVAQLWEAGRALRFFSVLNYFRPVFVLRGTDPVLPDLLVLGAAGVGFWTLGGLIISRRDICTV